jgi:hypothetical protein
LYQFQFCSKQLHFYNNFAITPKLFPTDGIYVGSKEAEICGNKFWAVWWLGKKVQPTLVIVFCGFKLVCFRDGVLQQPSFEIELS